MSHEKRYYETCEECPLSVFEKCLIHGNLKSLIISGEPSPEELAMVWANLYAEFTDLNQDGEQLYILKLRCDVQLLSTEIYEVDTILYFLQPAMLPFSIKKKDELLGILNDYDLPTVINFSEDYSDKLQMIDNRMAVKRMQLANKEGELISYLKERENESVDKHYFRRMLRRLSQFRGHQISINNITVLDFVLDMNDYLNQNSKEDTDGSEG